LVFLKCISSIFGLLLLTGPIAFSQESSTDTRPGIAPDIRQDETSLKIQRGDFVVVPIPISNPTLDTGLVAGAAYFYPQSEQQKALQPASVTGAAGMYTSNDSRAIVLVQQNYWKEDLWRFTGAIGQADLRLSLLVPEGSSGDSAADWRLNGTFVFAKIARRLKGHWYGGIQTRFVDADQSIEIDTSGAGFNAGPDVRSAGVGLLGEYDSRDMPMNSFSGRHLQVDALINDEAIGSNTSYQSYSAAFRSYHELTDSLVLAWDLQACKRSGSTPLWDACRLKLRGFSATDYLGKASASGQIEARWRMTKRWGLVGFAGAGTVSDSFSSISDHDTIPSYGVGIRFMVLAAKRINLRVDFARSDDSDAVHISVGEAF
jgi:hypothetical protein